MNATFTKEFFSWLDSDHVDTPSIAKELKNTESTLAKWKSRGIPTGKLFACQALMDKAQEKKLEDLRHSMILKPTHAQFTRWNRAALANKQIIEDWAFEGLETMADEYFSGQSIKAAEDPALYTEENNILDGNKINEIEANKPIGENGTTP